MARRMFSRACLTAAVSMLTLGLVALGTGTARAQAHPDVRSAPAKVLSHTAGPRGAGTAANSQSTNWSGYVANTGTYTSVSSSWVMPTVSCTATGIVSFEIGLDGWGDSSVVENGTAVDCRSGSPRYYAWWELYPTNSEQDYSVTVQPGDSLASTITYGSDGQYHLALSDSTQGWTENTTVAAPSGAKNASAEILTALPSINGSTSPLPQFTPVHFTGSTVNGGTLQAAGAQALDLVNSGGTVIDTTGPDDTSGDFAVYYGSSPPNSTPLTALQASNGDLWTYSPSARSDLALGMAAGTSPAIAGLADGSYEIAFQANTGYLWTYSPSAGASLGLGMAAGTSPAIAGLNGGGYVIAFQANTGSLWIYSPSTGAINTGLGMAAGTSPAIAGLADGSYEIAFQANTGYLWTYSPSAGASLGLGMAAGTSPAIAGLNGGGYVIAFQANTGSLWTVSSLSSGTDLSQSMKAGTSPSIAVSPTGEYQVAFQAATGDLSTYSSTTGANALGLGMAAGTSPALAVSPAGGFEIAYQAGTGYLSTYTSAAGMTSSGLSMLSGTDPAAEG